jgi:SAM-dependent methyltransferase
MEKLPHFPESAIEWLNSPLGNALLAQEGRVVEEVLDGMFGEQCLQLGQWGDDRTFLKHARTQRTALIDEGVAPPGGPSGPIAEISAIGEFHRLPVASDSIDCVLLPHTLDFSDRPHAILREVHRVLRSDGHLVILGFKTGGLWGLRRLIPGAGLPPGAEHMISDRRLRDWLQLLDLRIHGVTRYFFRWPIPGNRGASSANWERRGRRLWPELAACYMLTAQKRVSTLTPVRPRWRRKPKVVAGLAGTTNRVSRIRFDQNS